MKTYTIYLKSGNKIEGVGRNDVKIIHEGFEDWAKKDSVMSISFYSGGEMIRVDLIEAIIEERPVNKAKKA